MVANTKADEIRTAARRLFLRRGLRDASMAAIPEEANVSRQTLHRHHGSRDQLFVGVLMAAISPPPVWPAGRLPARDGGGGSK